eukprot:2507389-Lingulodinium_polyedra.AAC.1
MESPAGGAPGSPCRTGRMPKSARRLLAAGRRSSAARCHAEMAEDTRTPCRQPAILAPRTW